MRARRQNLEEHVHDGYDGGGGVHCCSSKRSRHRAERADIEDTILRKNRAIACKAHTFSRNELKFGLYFRILA